jgi:hypothetical protein
MDRRRIMREMTYLTAETGRVVAGVLQEIAAIPFDRQQPQLVAEALACARVVDDPESFSAAPAAFARLMAKLDALHEGVDDDVR